MSEHSDNPLVLVPPAVVSESEVENRPERRGFVRYPFTAAAEVTDLRSQTRVSGRSSDLGLGGCYIDILSPFAVGSDVHVRLEREQHVFEAFAIVTYAQVSMGMGLAFTETKAEHQSVLQAWVMRLSGTGSSKHELPPSGSESEVLSNVLNLQQVLNEFINLMVRRKAITESEGTVLLRQLFR